MRIQKWCLALIGYDYNLVYKRGKDNTNVDALSRLPVPPSNRSREVPEPEEMVLLVNQLNNGPVSARDIAKATTYDPVLSKLMNFVMTGWPNDNKDDDLTEFF